MYMCVTVTGCCHVIWTWTRCYIKWSFKRYGIMGWQFILYFYLIMLAIRRERNYLTNQDFTQHFFKSSNVGYLEKQWSVKAFFKAGLVCLLYEITGTHFVNSWIVFGFEIIIIIIQCYFVRLAVFDNFKIFWINISMQWMSLPEKYWFVNVIHI